MALNHLGSSAQMGPLLQKEVERQLINDLENYHLGVQEFNIDWSDACQEGHCTTFLDGNLESLSHISIQDSEDNEIAEGWMDFIHGGNGNPLFVFWLFLSIQKDGKWISIKTEPIIPTHIWEKLPSSTKQLCTQEGKYDETWAKDPLVQAWKNK